MPSTLRHSPTTSSASCAKVSAGCSYPRESRYFTNLKDIQCSRRHYNSAERSDNWCLHRIRKVRRLTYSVENTSFCDTKTLNLSFIVRGGMANTQSKAATGMLDNRLSVMLISCLCFQRRTCAPRTRVATAASVSTAKRTTSASVDVALPGKIAKDVRHNNKHPTGVDCNKLDSLTKNKPSTHKQRLRFLSNCRKQYCIHIALSPLQSINYVFRTFSTKYS